MEIEWDESLRTGVQELDKQHRALFNAMATMHQAIEDGRSKVALRQLTQFLEDYVLNHFKTEEMEAARYGYPVARAEAHAKEHAAFKAEVQQLVENAKKGNYDPHLLTTMVTRVSRWFGEHIYRADMDLARWIWARRREEPLE